MQKRIYLEIRRASGTTFSFAVKNVFFYDLGQTIAPSVKPSTN